MAVLSLSPLASSSPWRHLPPRPGIYIYKDAVGKILYVGKAINLQNRVRSYFQPPTRLGPKTSALVVQIVKLEHIEVNSEVEALLLESKLIKRFQPPYNIASKDDKSPYFIHISQEDYPMPLINHQSLGAIAGPFLNGLIARRILKQFRRITPYCLAHRPVTRPCFYSHLNLCHPCPATGQKVAYRENISRLKKLLAGQFTSVSSQLKKDMSIYSRQQKYENAAEIKTQLEALNHLLQTPISPEEYLVNPNLIADTRQTALDSLKEILSPYIPNLNSLNRIEMYDVANLSGTSATSAMTVAIDGEVSSRAYRHFTIKGSSTPNDVAMLNETLTRRLSHSDWPVPDLIVLDGGKPQLSIHKSSAPIIALAKREEIITIPNNEDYIEIKLPENHPGLLLLERLRDEAHRFSRRLHHKHTSQKMLK